MSGIQSEVRVMEYPSGERQRLQLLRFDSWRELEFFAPPYSPEAYGRICRLYRDFVIPRCPQIFGQLVFFRLLDDIDFSGLSFETRRYGRVADPLTAAAVTLRRGVIISGGKPHFLTGTAKALWKALEERDSVFIAGGKLPNTTIMPVRNSFGFMSGCETGAAMKVNSSFFILDKFDCSSAYDRVGTPFGLRVKDGEILSPPLFSRQALLVRSDGRVGIEKPELKDLSFRIRGAELISGKNAEIFERPICRKTPFSSRVMELIIIGREIAAVRESGGTLVPSSGFVLRVDKSFDCNPGDSVEYIGLSDVIFGIQAGNSAVISGEKTERFISPFYNIHRLWSNAYPPSLYPLDYENARAPRIVLGADRDGRPMLVWLEGAAKFGYNPGDFSCGASLSEAAEICRNLGMYNAVHLDGGGSAQIITREGRALMISDRKKEDLSEQERAVPMGLLIR